MRYVSLADATEVFVSSDIPSDSVTTPDLESIIDQLIDAEGVIPEQAIAQARENSTQITPWLIELLEDATSAHLQGYTPEDNGHFFAVYLLTEFRAIEAWPALLESISLPGEGPFDLFGDAITEDFGFIIATLIGDRWEVLDELISDRSLNEHVRWQLSKALLYLVRDKVVTREHAIEQLSTHLRRAIENRDEDIAVGLVLGLEDLAAQSAVPLIEQACQSGIVRDDMMTLEPTVRNIARGDDAFHESMSQLRDVGDLMEHLNGWAEFSEESDDELLEFDLPELPDHDSDEEFTQRAENPTTIRDDGFRVGRNESCPCGSGKKYKRCCGRR